MTGCLRTVCAYLAVLLAGCGTYMPAIQDIGDDVAGRQLVQAIIYNITCEVQDGINDIYRHRTTTFLDSWGVQFTLNLTIEERGAISPSLSYFPTSMFILGAGGSLSSDATRIEKINSYYTVRELLRIGRCTNREDGIFLRASDLGLKGVLFDNLTASDRGLVHFSDDPKGPLGTNVISHEVKFEVVASGEVTPAWALKYIKINPISPLLSASRDRTHDLIITLGPTDASGTAPSRAAQDSALASDIGVAVGNNVRNLRVQ